MPGLHMPGTQIEPYCLRLRNCFVVEVNQIMNIHVDALSHACSAVHKNFGNTCEYLKASW